MANKLPTAKPLDECVTYADRLLWVVKNRFGGDTKALADRVGLNRTTLTATIRRGGQLRGDNSAVVAAETGVSLAWLISGSGHPDDPPRELVNDPYPKRVIAIVTARRDGVPSHVIARVQQLTGEDYRSKSAARWSELIWKIHAHDMAENLKAAVRELNELRNAPQKAKKSA